MAIGPTKNRFNQLTTEPNNQQVKVPFVKILLRFKTICRNKRQYSC